MLRPLSVGDEIPAERPDGRVGFAVVVEAYPDEGRYLIEHPDGSREEIRDAC